MKRWSEGRERVAGGVEGVGYEWDNTVGWGEGVKIGECYYVCWYRGVGDVVLGLSVSKFSINPMYMYVLADIKLPLIIRGASELIR